MKDPTKMGGVLTPEAMIALRFDEAKVHFQKRDWMGAIVEAEELLEEVPDHLEALFLVRQVCPIPEVTLHLNSQQLFFQLLILYLRIHCAGDRNCFIRSPIYHQLR